jgi:hypothetical protein
VSLKIDLYAREFDAILIDVFMVSGALTFSSPFISRGHGNAVQAQLKATKPEYKII